MAEVFTARQLVSDAYALSGIVGNEFQNDTGGQLSQGLTYLNDFLAIKSADTRLIPYYKLIHQEMTVGKGRYFIENLIAVSSVTFNLDNVRYSMQPINRRDWYGSSRVNNINSLPYSYHFERAKGGGYISVYFKPSQEFLLNIEGKFSLSSVAADTDMNLNFDRFYLVYCKYGVAQFICSSNQVVFPPENQRQLTYLEKVLSNISPLDTQTQKISMLGTGSIGNWAFVNLGNGWVP